MKGEGERKETNYSSINSFHFLKYGQGEMLGAVCVWSSPETCGDGTNPTYCSAAAGGRPQQGFEALEKRWEVAVR